MCDVLGEVIGKKAADVRNHMLDEVATLRRELVEATTKLNERLARLPLVKTWTPDAVHYTGDVVVCDGSVYQARRDTGTAPAANHPHWICIARAGKDGHDGASLNPRGALNAHKTYARFDLVECNGNSYVAIRDNPGIPEIDDGWQLLAKSSRGPSGDAGPRGQRGARGPRGEDAPTIISWVLDHKNYTAIPTMSDGRAGAPLELRGLFELFFMQTQGWTNIS